MKEKHQMKPNESPFHESRERALRTGALLDISQAAAAAGIGMPAAISRRLWGALAGGAPFQGRDLRALKLCGLVFLMVSRKAYQREHRGSYGRTIWFEGMVLKRNVRVKAIAHAGDVSESVMTLLCADEPDPYTNEPADLPAHSRLCSPLDMKQTPFRVGDKIDYEFRWPAVQAGDCSDFLQTFGLEHLPTGPDLRPFLNRFGFVLTGYDDDPHAIYEIPEARAFYQAFRQAWPFWFFACDLARPCLRSMTFCCLPTLQVVSRAGASARSVRLDQREVAQFVLENYRGLNLLCERAGMTEQENRERRQRIFEYYRPVWNGQVSR